MKIFKNIVKYTTKLLFVVAVLGNVSFGMQGARSQIVVQPVDIDGAAYRAQSQIDILAANSMNIGANFYTLLNHASQSIAELEARYRSIPHNVRVEYFMRPYKLQMNQICKSIPYYKPYYEKQINHQQSSSIQKLK
jgi:hypothetical protein